MAPVLPRRREIVFIEQFAVSADYPTLFREFGITATAVVEATKRTLAKPRDPSGMR